MSDLNQLAFEDFEQVSGRKGSNSGGVYRGPDGGKWYLKYPNSERQGQNEVMASHFYTAMGFDAIQYVFVDNGMVASRWRGTLPDRSKPKDLRRSDVVQEAFLPSALIANWDVIGLVYDNCLYVPAMMDEPVFLDFGGAFDTRAMGGHKDFEANSVPALEGFTDPSINQSAANVFEGMTPTLWNRSQRRVASLTVGEMRDMVRAVGLDGADERLNTLRSRVDILLDTEYGEVFEQ